MKLNIITSSAILLCTLATSSCTDKNGWSVEGTINGASEKKIAVQAFNNTNWYTIDSITVGTNDKFKYTAEQSFPFPEILRIGLENSYIYFPVEGNCTVTLTADADSFGKGYSLTGIDAAPYFVQIDSMISEAVATLGDNEAATDSLLKRNLTKIALGCGQPIAAYYIINKRIGNTPLYDLTNKRDLAIIGAVAQAFDTELPDDPRTETLRNMFLAAKAAANPTSNETTIEVPEAGLSFDIKAFDNKGVEHSLYDVASKGDVVLLSFTTYEAENSPGYNVILSDIYKKYHSKGLEIFQVSFDADEAQWKQSAINLPWITVWNSPSDGSSAIVSYNVNILPLTYVIGRDGVLRTRVTDPTEIEKELNKLL